MAFEHLEGPVAGDSHDQEVVYSGLSGVGDEGVPEVVEPEILDLGPAACCLEAALDIDNGVAFEEGTELHRFVNWAYGNSDRIDQLAG